MVKTVDKNESEFFIRLLPGYYMNLVQNKRTLLPKYFGLYMYKGSIGKRDIRFVVMNNVLPTRFQYCQKFDLKGSTFRRFANEKECAKRYPCYKDLDYLKMHPHSIKLHSTQVRVNVHMHAHCKCSGV